MSTCMKDIVDIHDAAHSSANARSKYIRVDGTTEEGEVIRYRVPFTIPSTPDGPKVTLQWDDAVMVSDSGDGDEEQPVSEVPENVKQRMMELRNDIGNW